MLRKATKVHSQPSLRPLHPSTTGYCTCNASSSTPDHKRTVNRLLSSWQNCKGSLLLDRLICSIRDAWFQRTLLAKLDLNFKTAFELTQATKVAEQNAKDLRKSHKPVAPVHTVQKQQSRRDRRNCYRCGGKHAADFCRFKDMECHYCHKKGTSCQSMP